MTTFADSNQVILYTLLSETLVAFGAVVYLQRVARAVLVTQPALMAVQGEPGVTFGFPGGGLHVGFITGAVHRVLCWAGIPALPNLTGVYHIRSGLTTSRRAASRPTMSSLAMPYRDLAYLALQLVAAVRRCIPALPYRTRPNHALSRPASPSLARPRHSSSSLAMTNQTTPYQALPSPTVPHRAVPSLTRLYRTRPRRAMPGPVRPCNWSPLCGGVSLPCRTSPSLARPRRAGPCPAIPDPAWPYQAAPCPVLPRRTAPCPEKEINLPACLVALAEGCGPGDRRAGQHLRPYRPGASPGAHEKRPRHPSAHPSYHTPP